MLFTLTQICGQTFTWSNITENVMIKNKDVPF